jgi:hypothetical protein
LKLATANAASLSESTPTLLVTITLDDVAKWEKWGCQERATPIPARKSNFREL